MVGFEDAVVVETGVDKSVLVALDRDGRETGRVEGDSLVQPSPDGEPVFAVWLKEDPYTFDLGTGHTAAYSVAGGELRELWRVPGSLVDVSAETVVVQSSDRKVSLIPWDSESAGAASWTGTADHAVVVDEYLFTVDGTTITLRDATNGQSRWDYTGLALTPETVTTAAVTADYAVFLADGTLAWVELKDGSEVSRAAEGGGDLRWVGENRLVATPPASFDHSVPAIAYAFDGSAEVVKSADFGRSRNIAASVRPAEGLGYVAFNGRLYDSDLNEVARYGTPDTWLVPISDGALVFGSGSSFRTSTVAHIDPTTGEQNWLIATPGIRVPFVEPAMNGMAVWHGWDGESTALGTTVEFWS
ncbi:hypothetical protein [Nocardioides kribbensis]|uniref:PQQ-binding-like beta-propeller repeat protein n=1 Tax=Nocardioides kribbensis TaxID=305517 RepID=A0ABV1NWU7_9ACTN